MLQIQAIGYIGNDAKTIDNQGNQFINFQVATSEKFKKKDGESVEKTTWLSCNIDSKSTIKQYLKKGTQVYLQGTITMKVYTNGEGASSISITVNCSKVELLGSKKEEKEG